MIEVIVGLVAPFLLSAAEHVVLAAGGIGLMILIDKYTPNNTRITLNDYYADHGYLNTDEAQNTVADAEAFIIFNSELSSGKA